MMRPDLQGRPLILLIVDAHTRHPLLAVPATSVADIATTLERLCRQAGRPQELRIDHALEFNLTLRDWAHEHGVRIIHASPTMPQLKAASEPIFRSLADHLRGKHFTTASELGRDVERWRESRNEYPSMGPASMFLGVTKTINAEAVTAILGGIAGYAFAKAGERAASAPQ